MPDVTFFELLTPRLRLREFVPAADAAALFALNADPRVTRYTGDGPFASVAATEAFFRERCAQYARVGMGRWAVELRTTGEVLGWCGLRQPEVADKNDEFAVVDLGYRFFRRHWGQGYATEAAHVCLDYGFGVLALPQIVVRIDLANAASRRVAHKLGFRPVVGRLTTSSDKFLVLQLTAAEWYAAPVGPAPGA